MSFFHFILGRQSYKKDEMQIRLAIEEAEQMTSGEIKVILERKKRSETAELCAKEWFEKLQLFRTKQRNAVLIYVALKKKEFYILGDEGIYQKLGTSYWGDVVCGATEAIKRERSWVVGICYAIHFLGKSLKAHYPFSATDENELDDEVSVV